MSLQRAAGLAGSALVAIGVFLPALSFPELGGNTSLWETHRWVAVILLLLAVVAVYCCGAAQYGRLLPLAIVIYGILGYQLLAVLSEMESQTQFLSHLEKNERGWANLVRAFSPSMHWLAWTALLIGAGLFFVAAYVGRERLPIAQMTVDTPTED